MNRGDVAQDQRRREYRITDQVYNIPDDFVELELQDSSNLNDGNIWNPDDSRDSGMTKKLRHK